MFKNKLLDTIFVLIRRCVYGVLYCTHFLPLRKNKIVILCYHSIGDDSWRFTVSMNNLKKQMAYMLKHYRPVSLETVEKYIRGEVAIDEPSFVVTFDDGYADIFQTKDYFSSVGIQPTVFVLADPENANKGVMESDREFLTNDQIHALKAAGWGIGCHTMTHSDLAQLDTEGIMREVIESKQKLEVDLGFSVPYIAYPLGNYTPEVLTAYDSVGYRMGLSMDDSYISTATDIRIVPRVGVDGSHTFIEFVATISDAIIFIRSLVKKAMKPREVKPADDQKRVAVVVRYFWPISAGTEVNIAETYSVLAQKGWSVEVHTSQDSLTEKNVYSSFERYRRLWVKRYAFRWWGFWPRIQWKKIDILALHNFNILPFYLILFYALVLKVVRTKHFKVILVPHGGFVLYSKHFSWWKRLLIAVFYYGMGVHLINFTVDAVRVVSHWEKEEMVRKGVRTSLIHVITNGTEAEAYLDVEKEASNTIRRQVAQYGKYVIQMGRIEPVKNYETMIHALKFLPEDVNYIIVGPVHDQKYKEYLTALIEKENLSQRVYFVGVITGIDKYYLLKHAQLMVHMSLWESYCNAVHEGLSQGLVCVVSNVTGLPELVRDGISGYCVDPNDYKTLAKRINSIIKSRDSLELQSITERSRKGVLTRSWSDVASDYARMVVA